MRCCWRRHFCIFTELGTCQWRRYINAVSSNQFSWALQYFFWSNWAQLTQILLQTHPCCLCCHSSSPCFNHFNHCWVAENGWTRAFLRMQLREQSIPRLGRRSKAYYGVRLERELLAAFDSCPERNFIALNDQNEVFGVLGEWRVGESGFLGKVLGVDFLMIWKQSFRTCGIFASFWFSWLQVGWSSQNVSVFSTISPPHGGQVLAIPRTLVGDVLESMGFAKAELGFFFEWILEVAK